jgi:predicted nucleotidyltransferase component of viral defense system
MFEEVLSGTTRRYLALLAEKGLSTPFYLGGGTAVALHLGHRLSNDLDFYCPEHFNVAVLDARLHDFEVYRRERLSEDTLLGALEDLRISFFWYRYQLMEEPVIALSTRILRLPDLAAMKIEAIAQRNTKRDFIDLYFMAHEADITPQKAIEYHRAKFAGLNINQTHLILSLGYFEEADDDIMPKMLIPVSWEEVKRYFARESQMLAKSNF